MLCANKVDLPADQVRVKRDDYVNFARDRNIPLVEVSACSGKNVNSLFYDLSKLILEKNRDNLAYQEEKRTESIVLFSPPVEEKTEVKARCC